METKFDRLEDNQIELKVTIPAAAIDKAIANAYAEANKNRIKGFRIGKAPRNILDQVFGGSEHFLAEATDEVIRASYLLAMDEQGFVPLTSPDLNSVEPAIAGEDYTYSFTFTVAPDLGLSSYEPVAIELPPVEPTADEIQSRVDTMLGYYAEFVGVSDRASQAGDTLTMEILVTHDGEKVNSMSGENVPFDIGFDQMPEEFESHFIGIEPGTELSFDFQMPYFDDVDDGQEQNLHVEATLKAISLRVVPELTDEWVQEKLEYESAEHFRQLIADSLRDQNEAALPSLKQRRVAEAVAERLEGNPPEELISEMAQDIYSDIFLSLQNQGITLDAYLASLNQDADAFRESVQNQAENNARQVMALDAWALHYEFEVTEEDIREQFERAETDDIDAAIQQWTEVGRMTELRKGILRMKATEQLNDEAVVTEEKPLSDEELAAIIEAVSTADETVTASAPAEETETDAPANEDTED